LSEQLANLYGSIISSTPVSTLVASVTLASAYTAGSGSIVVSDATGAPMTGTFSLTILNPLTGSVYLIFRVTSVSGTTFNGAAEGPDADAPSGAAVVGTMLTAAAIAQIKMDAAGSGLSASGYYLTNGTDYFVGPTFQPATLPVAADFSWINQGIATETASGNALVLHTDNEHSGSQNVNMRIFPIGANTQLIAAAIWSMITQGNSEVSVWFGFYESATGKLEGWNISVTSGNIFVQINNVSSPTGSFNNVFNSGTAGATPFVFIQLGISGGNITFSYSHDGVNFPVGYSETVDNFFTTAPDNFFYGVEGITGTQDVFNTLLSWAVS
jgi:hypothetical protein